MSKTRGGSKSKERAAKAGSGDWKRLVASGALVIAVAGTLILAAVLRAGPDPRSAPAEPAPRQGAARSAVDELPRERPVAPAPSPAAESPPAEEPGLPGPAVGDPLALRAARDRARLASHGSDWTLQFARLCEPDHARSILAELDARDDLYLVERDGCYRVCWGLFGSADLARSATGLPSVLVGLPDRPFPKRVEEALR